MTGKRWAKIPEGCEIETDILVPDSYTAVCRICEYRSVPVPLYSRAAFYAREHARGSRHWKAVRRNAIENERRSRAERRATVVDG